MLAFVMLKPCHTLEILQSLLNHPPLLTYDTPIFILYENIKETYQNRAGQIIYVASNKNLRKKTLQK